MPLLEGRKRAGSTIADKVVRKLKDAGRAKVVNLADIIAGRQRADDLKEQVASGRELAEFHPAHAPYVYAQNQTSLLSEQLTELKEMAPFVKIISKAEELHMPGGPPISPLTTSYFTSWAFFDACAGPSRETIATTILAVGEAFGMHRDLSSLIQSMQGSRMGIYVHRGVEHGLAVLEDIVTAKVCHAVSASGYRGEKGELWYVRCLPPPFSGAPHVVFTTPYVLLEPGFREWIAYFSRAVEGGAARIADYECHMKYGPTRDYWNAFVFEAYVNHRKDAIYLAGLPDVPESRPHSKVNGWSFGD